jgi:NhaP-type Na+/H+ or K+/H+ antiporter
MVLFSFLVFGISVVLITPMSGFLKTQACAHEPLIATIVGTTISWVWERPFSVRDPHIHGLVLELARVTIAVQVLSAGCEVKLSFYRKKIRTLVLFLSVVMIFMWLSSTFLVLAIFNDFSILKALMIGAMVKIYDSSC